MLRRPPVIRDGILHKYTVILHGLGSVLITTGVVYKSLHSELLCQEYESLPR